MNFMPRGLRFALALLPATLVALPTFAQDSTEPAPPASLQAEDETPWLYEGSNVPVDRAWAFGKLDNGLRYAVRNNGVPPDQVSIRIRIDVGSLHETEEERGFAHLLEHLAIRESKYLGPNETIPAWQRLGITFGADANALTSYTHTVYQVDLPDATLPRLDDAFRYLSGKVREPVINQRTLLAEVPVVLAEKREYAGAPYRVAEASQETFFAGQLMSVRPILGLEETILGAQVEAMQAFHERWYRPENVVIAVSGDFSQADMARLIERYFADWQVSGEATPEPNFGDPVPPEGASTGTTTPVGETRVVVEPDLPRSFDYAIMRPWRPVQDTITYNEGLLMDGLALSLINRRLEARARSGGDYLYAQAQQQDVARSVDGTFVTFAPLTSDWQSALADVRAVIADATTTPPTEEELQREIDEFEVAFVAGVEEAAVTPSADQVDTLVQAVDIRETTASAQTVLDIFRGMRERVTPQAILERTQALFEGDVVRSVYVTPDAADADAQALRVALTQPVAADGNARIVADTRSFADLPAIGEPGEIVSTGPLGLFEIERVEFANGVTAQLWPNDAEPGRVAVQVHFGAGMLNFSAEDAPYIGLAQSSLIGAGLAGLDQEALDRLATGRKFGFDFNNGANTFTFVADTREADLADQLYLFAAKLALPDWDPRPITRAQAGAKLAYPAFQTNPFGLINRDLEMLVRGGDQRFATATPEQIDTTTPEGFREVWEPLLAQGPVEVLIYGQFDRDAAVEALSRTFGALEPRIPLDPADAAPLPRLPPEGETEVLFHRGDANQGAAVVVWPIGSGPDGIRDGRQLEIVGQIMMNRLFDELRQRAGASYSPQVLVDWPMDAVGGGSLMAYAQLSPENVPFFYAAAEGIARDLATNPPTADEIARVTEPLRQAVLRASSGNGFWMWQLRGATRDPQKLAVIRTLLDDYSVATPERIQQLVQEYLKARDPFRIAVIPEGQTLAETAPAGR